MQHYLHLLFSIFPLSKFQVNGESMMPYYKNGDAVLINKLSYFFKNPKINDVVVCRNKNKMHIIKRIARINPSADGNKYFVLGDNKDKSTDSRDFGWVYKKEIIGKVIFRIIKYR